MGSLDDSRASDSPSRSPGERTAGGSLPPDVQDMPPSKHTAAGGGQAPRCENCGIAVLWEATISGASTYCCGGCAAGGPCYCSYDGVLLTGELSGARGGGPSAVSRDAPGCFLARTVPPAPNRGPQSSASCAPEQRRPMSSGWQSCGELTDAERERLGAELVRRRQQRASRSLSRVGGLVAICVTPTPRTACRRKVRTSTSASRRSRRRLQGCAPPLRARRGPAAGAPRRDGRIGAQSTFAAPYGTQSAMMG